MNLRSAALALGLALGLAGCTSSPPIAEYKPPMARVELLSTPFFPQAEYQCGPAALATILTASGAPVTPEALTPYVYLPERKGSLQAEMIAATRRHQRIPYVLEPDFNSLLAEVAAGTPVLILQNLALRMVPRWHYAVVIGYDAATDSLLLRSGTKERLPMNRIRFQGAWARGDNWAMVAVKPENLPPTARANQWLAAASAYEELGKPEIAATAYRAATLRWPEQPLPWLALANAEYSLKNLAAAETALRRAAELSPASAATHNNLAQVLSEQGCHRQAMAEIRLAETQPDAAALGAVLAKTKAEIDQNATSNGRECPLPQAVE